MTGATFTAWLAPSAALAGMALAAFLAAITSPEQKRLAVLMTTLLCLLGAAFAQPWLQVGTGWIAGSVTLDAALVLAFGWLARWLSWVVVPVLALAALATWSVRPPSLDAQAFAVALAALIAVSGLAGWALRGLRHRGWLREFAMLSMLAGVALMSAPLLSLGWRRAAIAAEGQDPAPEALPLMLWPLILAAAAFFVGAIWRVFASGTTRTRASR